MRGQRNLLLAAILALGSAVVAGAQPGVAVMVTGGTRGAGVDLGFGVADTFGARISVAGALSVDRTVEETDLTYEVELKPESAGLLLDLYPGGGSFRLTAGVLYNRGALDGEARPDASVVYEVGGRQYSGEQLGVVTAETSFEKVAPYLGIGFGNLAGLSSGLCVTFDVGAFYQGKPDVTLRATNPLGIPGVDEAIAQEELDLEEKLDSYRYYPVVTLGIGYRF